MAVKKELEVLPADESKPLKLGWVVHEVIGQAIVNTRAMGKAIPRHIFENEKGGIEIRRYSIQIFGDHEAAALAMAEELLKHKAGLTPTVIMGLPEDHDAWNYMKVVEATRHNKTYTINLTDDGLGLIDPEVWSTFKKSVEKITNKLTAFL